MSRPTERPGGRYSTAQQNREGKMQNNVNIPLVSACLFVLAQVLLGGALVFVSVFFFAPLALVLLELTHVSAPFRASIIHFRYSIRKLANMRR